MNLTLAPKAVRLHTRRFPSKEASHGRRTVAGTLPPDPGGGQQASQSGTGAVFRCLHPGGVPVVGHSRSAGELGLQSGELAAAASARAGIAILRDDERATADPVAAFAHAVGTGPIAGIARRPGAGATAGLQAAGG